MKGYKIFLKIDFAIQTLLIGCILLEIFSSVSFFSPEEDIKILVPMLAIWLIVFSTFEKIKYGNDLRHKINRVWMIIFLIGLVFLLKKS